MNQSKSHNEHRGMLGGILAVVLLGAVIVGGTLVTESEFLPIAQRVVGIGGMLAILVVLLAWFVAKLGSK